MQFLVVDTNTGNKKTKARVFAMYDCQRTPVPKVFQDAWGVPDHLRKNEAPGRGDGVDESFNIPRGDEIKYFHLDSCNTGGKADLD